MDNKDLFKVDEEIVDDIESINSMIEKEKVAQNKDKKEKSNVEVASKEIVPKQEVKPKVVEDTSYSQIMERLHLRIMGDTIDVLYRPNHCDISFLPNDENGKAEVKRLAEMSRDDFKKYLAAAHCFSFPTKTKIEEARLSNYETWYKGAWARMTKNLLDELGVTNPIEEPICVGE